MAQKNSYLDQTSYLQRCLNTMFFLPHHHISKEDKHMYHGPDK